MFDKTINEILALLEVKDLSELMNFPQPNKLFISKNCFFILLGNEKLSKYTNLIRELYFDKKEISETVDEDDFVKFLDESLLNWKINNIKVSQKEINEFFKYFVNIPLEEYTIAKEIYGISLNNIATCYQLGPFKIYYLDFYKKILAQENKIFELEDDIFFQGWKGDFVVTAQIKARSINKAKELAFDSFYKFELFIYFTLNNYNQKHFISIVSKLPYPYDNCLILGNKNTSNNFSRIILETIPLDDPYFTDPTIGNNNLWNLLEAKNFNALEKRIISSIEWIGKANSEINITNRFLFYIIALESVLTIQDQSLVNPSVASSICESSAFILGATIDERIQIETIVKNLYKIRSALAHGKDKDIKQEDMVMAATISENIIHHLLSDSKLLQLKSPSELSNYIKRLRYS